MPQINEMSWVMEMIFLLILFTMMFMLNFFMVSKSKKFFNKNLIVKFKFLI